MGKIPCAVLGCTGLVGQYFVKLLSNHPFFEIKLLTASENSKGKKLGDFLEHLDHGDLPDELKKLKIELTSEKEIINSGIKLVFSALPSSVAGTIEDNLRREGIFVFSNSGAHRMDSDVPILIPEINPEHISLIELQRERYGGFIITNSNCTTSGLAIALKPLLKFGVKRVFMSSYQSISGAGRKGLPSMDILGNLIPYIKDEEEKVERETRKILGSLMDKKIEPIEFELAVNCCRVPVKVGHLESVMVELDRDFNIEEILNAFNSFKGIPQEARLPSAPEKPLIVREENNRPQPGLDSCAGNPERAKGMAVSIGRIRKKGKILVFFLLVNNLVRGSAGGSVLNAEFAYYKGILGR